MLIHTIRSIHIVAGLAVAASLLACASPPDAQDHARHHSGQPANTAPPPVGASSAQGGMAGGAMTGSQAGCGMMGGSTTGSQAGCGMMGDNKAAGGMRHMDREAMCAMYRSMRDAPTEQARLAMMDRNMQAMSPEMRERHIEMMREQCQ